MSLRKMNQAMAAAFVAPLLLLIPGLALLYGRMWLTAALTLTGVCISLYLATESPPDIAILYLLVGLSIHFTSLAVILALKGN